MTSTRREPTIVSARAARSLASQMRPLERGRAKRMGRVPWWASPEKRPALERMAIKRGTPRTTKPKIMGSNLGS